MTTHHRDIVAIGGSAGSGSVLRALLADLPADLPAAVFVVVHQPARGAPTLLKQLAAGAALPARIAVDGQPVERGHIYLAPSDVHLLIAGDAIRLGYGPRENRSRPAIDPLFRSAALACDGRTIGVVLSGLLDDGAAGLGAIKQRGGMAIVQHPLDAAAAQMPLAALEAAEVDHVAPAAALAATIVAAVGEPAGPAGPVTDALRLEVEIAGGMALGSDRLRALAEPTALTCPDCQGVLSEVRGGRPLRYRCQIGHGFTAQALAEGIGQLDEAIRVAMRIMEERVTLVQRTARDARDGGRSAVAQAYESRAAEYRRYASTLREAATATLRMATRGRETS